uniref:Uncharacterized protein n=1 Tax=Timema genevievae TaxID=629358 RepID=A0A7R9K985_TIMGE|nr:unnamed protein product [Timema genevievae]
MCRPIYLFMRNVSHFLLISSDRMKPRSGDWAVTIDFLQETTITSLSNGSNVNGLPTGSLRQRMNNHRFDKHYKDLNKPVPIHAGNHTQDF